MNFEILSQPNTPEGRARGRQPIIYGLIIIALAVAACYFLPAKIAAVAMGILVALVVCYIVIMKVPRGVQTGFMGTALGISADAGYAQLNDKTPVTVANLLIRLVNSITQAFDQIWENAGVHAAEVTPLFVWTFIGATIVFMGLSFLIDHDG